LVDEASEMKLIYALLAFVPAFSCFLAGEWFQIIYSELYVMAVPIFRFQGQRLCPSSNYTVRISVTVINRFSLNLVLTARHCRTLRSDIFGIVVRSFVRSFVL
jgi:hypothetical protein